MACMLSPFLEEYLDDLAQNGQHARMVHRHASLEHGQQHPHLVVHTQRSAAAAAEGSV